MRVLQLITQARGGPADHAVEVAIELARIGHDSHLAGPAGDHTAAAAANGVHLHPVELRSKADLRGMRVLADLVTALQPDVVHLQDRRAGLVGRALAGTRSIPTVYTLHGVPDELATLVRGNLAVAPGGARDRIAYLLVERLLALGPRSAVVTPCEALAAYAREHVGVARTRVHTVPNGVGREWLVAGRLPTGTHDGRTTTAVWLGLMEPVKRVPDLVRAAARVPDLRVELVGDGTERRLVERVVAQTHTSGTVHLAGYQADPAPYLRAADVFVLPSAAEACPMALLQAMACGTPVIASRAGGIPEIVRDGVDGLLVDPGDVEGLTAALRTLAADGAGRRAMGANARARIAGRFIIDRSVRSLVAIYERTVACAS